MAREKKQAGFSLVPVKRKLTDDALADIVEMAHKRAALIGEMRAALLAHDDALALKLARRVCGLETEAA